VQREQTHACAQGEHADRFVELLLELFLEPTLNRGDQSEGATPLSLNSP